MEFPCNQCTDDPIASNTKKEQGESTLNERDPAINRNECTDASSATLEVDSFVKRHSKGQALFLNFSSDLSPQKVNKAPKKCKRQAAYRVNGVNILNRNNLDSKTVIERIQKRRENHNHVERRRRDNINSTILELSQIVPNALQPNQKPNKGNILKLTLDYVKVRIKVFAQFLL
ncbi:helix-loop-helix DNA-binding domain-containing protein [Chlamydoabsidia padenii]|nr:helix-loop-helix DNA-binding domain-containing protein [Chlamydoabsidia padenii]